MPNLEEVKDTRENRKVANYARLAFADLDVVETDETEYANEIRSLGRTCSEFFTSRVLEFLPGREENIVSILEDTLLWHWKRDVNVKEFQFWT